MYDRILVPTDGSPGVERAVGHAIDLAVAHGATIHAIYVVNSASVASLPMESSWEGVSEMLRADGEAAVERVEDLATEAGVAVRSCVIDGSPSREIVRYAEREGCDLVVMGTHGRGGIDRLLLGSVAERVVRSSRVPVLTVQVGEGLEDDEDVPAEEVSGEETTPEAEESDA